MKTIVFLHVLSIWGLLGLIWVPKENLYLREAHLPSTLIYPHLAGDIRALADSCFYTRLESAADRAFSAQRFSGGRSGRRFAPPSVGLRKPRGPASKPWKPTCGSCAGAGGWVGPSRLRGFRAEAVKPSPKPRSPALKSRTPTADSPK